MVQVFYYGTLLSVFALLAHTTFAHICDVCDCQPSRNEAFTISCGCESTKHLHFTASMMTGAQSAAIVLIKDCQTVSVERNSFSQLGKLQTLSIQNCSRLYLATGAFSSLNSLLINNVQDISFGEMALMGARDVKNIIISTSNITELPKYALYDVKGMESFSLMGVRIGKIHSHAFNVTANSVEIANSKVDYTESNGLTLRAHKVMIRQSEFDLAAPGAIQITTTFQTRLIENNFRSFFQLNITSPFAELFGNRFQGFDAGVLARVQSAQLINNLIFYTDYDSVFRNSMYYKDFYDNEFGCRCGMNLLNRTRNSNNDEILKRNYCMANCTLSLFDFEVESLARCMRDRQVEVTSFCNYERAYKSNPSVLFSTSQPDVASKNFTDVKIQPRFLDLDGSDASAGGKTYATTLNVILTIFAGTLISYLY